jgi:hypothetical protein
MSYKVLKPYTENEGILCLRPLNRNIIIKNCILMLAEPYWTICICVAETV